LLPGKTAGVVWIAGFDLRSSIISVRLKSSSKEIAERSFNSNILSDYRNKESVFLISLWRAFQENVLSASSTAFYFHFFCAPKRNETKKRAPPKQPFLPALAAPHAHSRNGRAFRGRQPHLKPVVRKVPTSSVVQKRPSPKVSPDTNNLQF
jgi:hypothetical protein